MTRQTTLFLVCAFEIALILFVAQRAQSGEYVYDEITAQTYMLIIDIAEALHITDLIGDVVTGGVDVVTGGVSIITENVEEAYNALTTKTPETNAE
jgi:hypothetical protein